MPFPVDARNDGCSVSHVRHAFYKHPWHLKLLLGRSQRVFSRACASLRAKTWTSQGCIGRGWFHVFAFSDGCSYVGRTKTCPWKRTCRASFRRVCKAVSPRGWPRNSCEHDAPWPICTTASQSHFAKGRYTHLGRSIRVSTSENRGKNREDRSFGVGWVQSQIHPRTRHTRRGRWVVNFAMRLPLHNVAWCLQLHVWTRETRGEEQAA